MSRAGKLLAALLALAVAGSAAFLWWQRGHSRPAVMAQIYQRGVLVKQIPLDRVGEPFSFPLKGENGAENTISVERGRIRVSHASCPDQVCVRQGWISDDSVPVVCLPNQVVIQISGGDSDVDATTG